MKKLLKKVRKYRYRSAKDGRYVSMAFALLHPFSTVRERIKDDDAS